MNTCGRCGWTDRDVKDVIANLEREHREDGVCSTSPRSTPSSPGALTRTRVELASVELREVPRDADPSPSLLRQRMPSAHPPAAADVLALPVVVQPLDEDGTVSATRISVPGRPVTFLDHGPSSASTGDIEGASRVAPVHDQPVKDRVLPSIPRTGSVALTGKGALHRIQVDGTIHARCRGGRVVAHRVISEDEAKALAADEPSRLCRYRWCFRDDVEALGINPWVGHVARIKRRIA